MVISRRRIPGHGYARLKKFALVGLILHRDPHWYRLQTLEARGRLKVRALFAAMQRRPTFGTFSLPIDIRRKRGGAIKTARGHYVLEQPGKPRAGDVDRRPGTRRLGPVGELAVSRPAIGVHVAPLSVLTVVVHVLNRLLDLALSQHYL